MLHLFLQSLLSDFLVLYARSVDVSFKLIDLLFIPNFKILFISFEYQYFALFT